MIYRIKIGYANCYLLSGENGSILIDTCNYRDGYKIYKRIKNENVKLILLTHCHFDHVGSAKYLSNKLNVKIAMRREDVHLIGNGQESKLHAHTLLGKIFAFFSQAVLKRAKYSYFEPEVYLTDEQDLSDYGVNARVIFLSGHTKGSVGVMTDDGEFIVGDAMFNIIRPTSSRLYENRAKMEESVQKIRKSNAKTIYVGHGKQITMKSIS